MNSQAFPGTPVLDSDGTITDKFLKELYSTAACYYCKSITHKSERTLDHKISLIDGGKHSADNCVMSCVLCNSSKGRKSSVEFLKILDGRKKKNIC